MGRELCIASLLAVGCGGFSSEVSGDTDAETDGSGSGMTVATLSGPNPTTMPGSSATMPDPSTSGTDPGPTSNATTNPGCIDSSECGGATPHCDGAGECVQCLEDEHCESDACDDGECAGAAQIAVAVGYGFKRVWSADGVDWQDFQEVNPDGGDDNDLLRGVGYGNGIFVGVGGASMGVTVRSTDGVVWTDEFRMLGSFLSDVVYVGDTFIAAGGNGMRVRSVNDGASFGDPAGFINGHFRGLATDGERAVAVGHTNDPSPTGMWSTTVDGQDWTVEVVDGLPFRDVTFGGGVFVAVGDSGRASYSGDGVAWTDTVLGDGMENLFQVLYADGVFLTSVGGTLWTTKGGDVWVEETNAAPRPLFAFFGGGYFALDWPAAIHRTEDLLTYEEVFSPGGSGLTDIAIGTPAG